MRYNVLIANPDRELYSVALIGVTLTNARYFCKGIKQFYPCPDMRIVTYEANPVIKEEIKGNNEVKIS